MTPSTFSADIDRPAIEVFAYATDPSPFYDWRQGVTRTPRVGRGR